MTAPASSLALPMLATFAGFTAWTLGDAAVRHLNDLPVFTVAFLASLVTVFWLLALSPVLGGVRQTFTMPKLRLRILRGLVIACSTFLAFVTFAYLEMATAYAIIFVAPLLSKVLSVLLTKEQIRMRSWLITALGFAGVLIVLRPGLVPLNIGTTSALALTLFFALGFVMSRWIGRENQTMLSLGIFQYSFVVVGAAVPAFLTWPEALSFTDLAFIAAIGTLAVIGALGVSYGYANAPAAIVAPIHYTQILFGILWGILFFGEYPDAWTLTGGAIIILSGLLLIRYSRKPPV